MTTKETPGLNPHESDGGQTTNIATDGGECDAGPDWEEIARREISSTLQALLEMDVSEAGYSIIHALGEGEEVEGEQLGTVRARFSEFDERITHALGEVGDLDLSTDAEQLETRRRGIDFDFRRMARSARKDKLCAHEIDNARESLSRARSFLDELEAGLEEDDGE